MNRDTLKNNSAIWLKNMSVLYVEDEVLTLEHISHLISPLIKKLYKASDGSEGLAIAKDNEIDIIITDIDMPKMNGIEMCKKIKQINSYIPIIITTYIEETNYLKEAIDVGVNHYVLKPIDLDALIKNLYRCAKSIFTDRELNKQTHLNELMLNSLSFPTMLFNRNDFKVLSANNAAKELGYFPYENIIGQFIKTEQIMTFLKKISEDNKSSFKQIKFPDVKAYEKIWDIILSNVADDIILFFAIDMTEQKRIERMKEDSERIVRHDLKSPLNSILGYIELIIEFGGLAPKFIKYAENAYESGKSMATFIDHAMDIFKLEDSSYKFSPSDFNIREMLEKIENEFLYYIQKKNIDLSVNFNGNPLKLISDYNMIGEKILIKNMLSNLIKNAFEASPANSTITVNIDRKEKNHEINIHNMGVVPIEVQDRFFDKYSTSGKNKGTGIGTYSAYLITKLHKGEISYTTSDEKGTHVYVTLPLSY
ncbi:MAG: hybrid sensor histidine kinase/response regulator [Desulfobacterales bacterium]|nr:hybrid sensor histidine kinase/response regulator [Desulfobacterales bacterium]